MPQRSTRRPARAPGSGPRRSLGAGLALGLLALVASCTEPPPIPPATLGSPIDLAPMQVCVEEESPGGAVLFQPAEACDEDSPSLRTRVAVATTRSEMIHVVEADARAGIVNFRADVPGVSGVQVDGTPTSLASLASAPSIVLVGMMNPPGLAAVDTATGRRVAFATGGGTRNSLELPGAPTQLRRFGAGETFGYLDRTRQAFVTFEVLHRCGERGSTHASDCRSLLAYRETGRLRLDATPLAWAADDDGVVWLTREERADLVRLGAFEPARSSECGGGICVLDRVGAGRECFNGIDDDGDGLIDADDPQCFDPDSREDGTSAVTARVFACSDGLDNDSDGLIDADDPGCPAFFVDNEDDLIAARPVCSNGLDDDLDGLIDGDDPDCATTGGRAESLDFAPLPFSDLVELPACANGLDDDADGLIDYPADPGCFGPSTDTETTPLMPRLNAIAVTEEQDFVVVADASGEQVLVLDRATRTLVDVHADRTNRSGDGVRLPSGQPATLTTGVMRAVDVRLRDGRRLVADDRVAFVPHSSGSVVPVELDRAWIEVSADGEEETLLESSARMRRRDADNSAARVRTVSCRLPRDAALLLNDDNVDCEDERLPRPVPINPDLPQTDDTPYTTQAGDAYALLPREPAWVRSEDERSIERIDLPIDWDVAADRFRMVWEGELPGTAGQDGLLLDDTGVFASLGNDPCLYGEDPCVVGLDLASCPDVEALCRSGQDLCAPEMDFCAMCPRACRQGADFCELGVLPGDRLLLDRLDRTQGLPDVCNEYSRVPNPESGEVEIRELEYLVTDVRGGRLQIAPLPADRVPFGSVSPPVPPRSCYTRPVGYEVRAGDSWVFEGQNAFGYASTHTSIGGQCVPRADADRRNGRPRLDARYVSPWGLEFEVQAGTVPPLRDFQLEFDVRSGFADRNIVGIDQLRSGIGSRAIAFFRSRLGYRLVVADASIDTLWVYQGPSFVRGTQVR